MTRPTRIVALACLFVVGASSTAVAQTDVDELWERYDRDATEFVELQTACDEGNIEATTTNRICRQAVEAGFRYAETMEGLLATDDSLSGDEQAALIDGVLTTRQIAASIMVDLGQCADAVPVLEGILEHPGTPDRPVVSEATQRWLDNANTCIEAQREPIADTSVGDGDDTHSAGPIVMMAGGGALVVGGFVWDAAMASERATFTRELDDCRTSAADCDATALDEAKNNIEGARVPIATLIGVGAATAVGGVIWYAVDRRSPRDDGPTVRLSPARLSDGTRTYYGARLRARF